MKFKIFAIITAIVSLLLGAGYLFAGSILIGRWQIEPTDSVLLFVRRMGALYLGLAVMFFIARSVPVSVARMAISAGAAVGCSLLALLGLYEFSVGRVGPGILVSIVVEALIALGFIWILFSDRKGPVTG
jgi:hypothetical protein